MNITVKEVVTYKGHSIKTNGSIDISFNAMYSELTNSMQVLQLLNNDVTIIAKLPGEKPFKIGSFNVKNVSFDGDGESTLKFNSIVDYVELDNINKLISKDAFQLKMEAEVDLEESDEETEEEE